MSFGAPEGFGHWLALRSSSPRLFARRIGRSSAAANLFRHACCRNLPGQWIAFVADAVWLALFGFTCAIASLAPAALGLQLSGCKAQKGSIAHRCGHFAQHAFQRRAAEPIGRVKLAAQDLINERKATAPA